MTKYIANKNDIKVYFKEIEAEINKQDNSILPMFLNMVDTFYTDDDDRVPMVDYYYRVFNDVPAGTISIETFCEYIRAQMFFDVAMHGFARNAINNKAVIKLWGKEWVCLDWIFGNRDYRYHIPHGYYWDSFFLCFVDKETIDEADKQDDSSYSYVEFQFDNTLCNQPSNTINFINYLDIPVRVALTVYLNNYNLNDDGISGEQLYGDGSESTYPLNYIKISNINNRTLLSFMRSFSKEDSVINKVVNSGIKKQN